MNGNQLPGGLWPVMLTPFTSTNRVDYDTLKRLTHFYIDAGPQGLFANCQSSEMFQLTDEERLAVINTVVAIARDRKVGVVATGTFSTDVDESAEFVKKVHDTGVDAVIVLTNQMANVDDGTDVLRRNLEKLMRLTGDIPLGTYECPYPYKRLLPPEMMQWMAASGRFWYHKDTCCNIDSIRKKIKAVSDSQFSFYNANTITALLSLEAGGRGISAIGANLYPELYAYLYAEFMENGATKQLFDLNAQLDLMDAIVDQCYPFSAKYFLTKRGFPITTVCRVSHGNINSEGLLKIEALMDVLKMTSEKFGVELLKF